MPIDRSAFLYIEPKSKKHTKNFAQCSDCALWLGPKKKLCAIHGPDVKVLGSMTCCFYVEGDPDSEQRLVTSVTTKESGAEDRPVRCENCTYFDKSGVCELFDKLNESKDFALNTEVIAKGCCNANMPKASKKSSPFHMS